MTNATDARTGPRPALRGDARPAPRAWRTPVCERLGIDLPIFGFSHGLEVAAAISRAGGYG
ncbi:MAG: hypothetical protein NTW15_03310, partial [Burkholderiales bacterium]|nr:hypothetical protein [Burkholderiales bacterium]